MTGFTQIDLSQLPKPAALENIAFEAILDARMQSFLSYWTVAQAADPTLPSYNVNNLETDPIVILQETDTYREIMVRARINDAVLATSLAYATISDLDVIAANYQTVRATGETDGSLRKRAQLAFENLSIGGSYGGYRYRALTAAPVELSDVQIYGHEVTGVAKGEVRVVCLGSNSTGIVASNTLQLVHATLSPRAQRKVNDLINVVSAIPANYAVDATLTLRRGADPATVVAAQQTRLAAYILSRRAIGAFVSLGGIIAALGHDDPGYVQDVQLTSSTGIVGGGPFDVPVCTGARVSWVIAP